MLAAALFTLCAAGPDVGFDMLFEPWLAPARGCAKATLPDWLEGTYVIGAPAGIEYAGMTFTTYLDSLGKFVAVDLAPRQQQACYRSRPLESKFYNDTAAAGVVAPSMLFSETAPPRPPCQLPTPGAMCDTMGGNDNNYVNSVVLGEDPTTLAVVTDSALVLDLDLATLGVKGKQHEWHDDLPTMAHISKMGSAHPLQMGAQTVGLVADMPMFGFEKAVFHLYGVDKATPNKRASLAKFELEKAPYLHSFGLSEKHAVLPMNTDVSTAKDMMTERAYASGMMAGDWHGVYVVDLEDGAHQVFNCTVFNHLHTANTYENATGVISDFGASHRLGVFLPNVSLTTTEKIRNKTARDAIRTGGNLFELTRFHMHTSGPLEGQCTHERISIHGRHTEFLRINPRMQGKPYCIYYAVEWFHDDESYGSMAVLQHNICTGVRKYWYRENWYPSEAIFVPRPAGTEEDDGALLFLAHDGAKRQSHFVVLDATTFEEMDSWLLPERMGFTAHAQFYPAQTQAVLV